MISPSGITYDGGESDDVAYCPQGHALDADYECARCETAPCSCCGLQAAVATLAPEPGEKGLWGACCRTVAEGQVA